MLEHDGEWLLDACWLRYLKVSKIVYGRDTAWYNEALWAEREEAAASAARKGTQSVPTHLPMPNILPPHSSAKGVDRLSALPHDVRYEILCYLMLPDFEGSDNDFLDEIPHCFSDCGDFRGRQRGTFGGHNINRLGLASKTWRDQVEAFCSHQLIVHKQMVAARCEGEGRWVEWRKLGTYTTCARMEYFVRAVRYCAFCGVEAKKRSSRSWPGLLCCSDECEACEVSGSCFPDPRLGGVSEGMDTRKWTGCDSRWLFCSGRPEVGSRYLLKGSQPSDPFQDGFEAQLIVSMYLRHRGHYDC